MTFFRTVMRGDEVRWSLEEVEIRPGSELEGRSLREADVRGRTGAVVLAVKTASGQLLTNPSPDRPLEAGDTLIALGTFEQLEKLGKEATSKS